MTNTKLNKILYGGPIPYHRAFEYKSLGELYLQRLRELGDRELLVSQKFSVSRKYWVWIVVSGKLRIENNEKKNHHKVSVCSNNQDNNGGVLKKSATNEWELQNYKRV